MKKILLILILFPIIGISQKKNLDQQDYYLSEEGYIVFTEKYHLKNNNSVFKYMFTYHISQTLCRMCFP